ncbi:13995_t:CDS:2, partial [Gigaspora rosea]
MPKEVKNDENAIIQTSITDYVGEECNFTMEILNNEFFVYTTDINYVDICFEKKNFFSNTMPQTTSGSLIQLKLLATYQNVSGNSKEKSENEVASSMHSSSFHDRPEFVSSNDSQSSKQEESSNDDISHQKKGSNSHKR